MKNWAIIVGINDYNNLTPLQYAMSDAEQMSGFLNNNLGFEKVLLFTNSSPSIPTDKAPIPTQPTFGNIRRFLRVQFEHPMLSEEYNLWFFFAGHGRAYEGTDYLMLSDSDPGDPESTAISVNYVADRLRCSGAGNIVLFLDSCRTRGDRDGDGIGSKTYPGVITFFSCRPYEKAWEIDELKQGSFTYALIEAFKIQSGINSATVERLDEYLRQRVPELNQEYGKENQNPMVRVEPAEKLKSLLLPSFAVPLDIEKLKNTAHLAERKGDRDLARQLWIQVSVAKSGFDLDAIEAFGRLSSMTGRSETSRSNLAVPDSNDPLTATPLYPPQGELTGSRETSSNPPPPPIEENTFSKILRQSALLGTSNLLVAITFVSFLGTLLASGFWLLVLGGFIFGIFAKHEPFPKKIYFFFIAVVSVGVTFLFAPQFLKNFNLLQALPQVLFLAVIAGLISFILMLLIQLIYGLLNASES
jgi:uncharacterized caspase-like protein